MGHPAARVTDMHICPATDPKPHVGGPLLAPGAVTVLVTALPAATMGDLALCVGPPDLVVSGSATVLICSRPAARMGDATAHGGTIVAGEPTVLVG